MGKISSLPASMSKVSTSVEKFEYIEKFCVGAYHLQTRADIVEGSGHRSEVGDQVKIIYSDQKHGKCEDQYISDQEHVCGTDNLMVYSVTVHFQFLYASRMDQSLQFFSDRLYQDHQTGYFNTAAGTSCTGAYQHKKHQDRPWDFRPLVKVCSRVSGGGDNRAYLESSLLESLSEAGVLIGHHYGDHNDRYQDDAEIPADFFNRKCFLEFFLKDQIVGAEVNTKEDHGDGHYYLQVYGIAGHTVVFDPESSGSGRNQR